MVETQTNPQKPIDTDTDTDIDSDVDADMDMDVDADTHKEGDTRGDHTYSSIFNVFNNELPREERIKQQQKLLYEQLEAMSQANDKETEFAN